MIFTITKADGGYHVSPLDVVVATKARAVLKVMDAVRVPEPSADSEHGYSGDIVQFPRETE